MASFDSTRAVLKRLCEIETTLTARDAEVQSLTLELTEKECLIGDLRVKVEDREGMLADRGRHLNATRADLQAKTARVGQLDEENKVLLELSEQRAMEVAVQKAGLEASKQRQADLNMQLIDSKARIKDLEIQFMNASALSVALSSKVYHLESDKANLESAYNEAEQRRTMEESKISELRLEAEVLRKELQGVRTRLEKSEHAKHVVEEELNRAVIRERDVKWLLGDYKREVVDSKVELSKVEEHQAQSRQELEDLRLEKERMLENLANVQFQLDSTTSSLKTTESDRRNLAAGLQIAQDQFEERTRELERVRAEAEESSFSFLEQIGALNMKFDSTHNDLQSARRALADMQQEHQELATARAQLESQHQALVLKSKSDAREIRRMATMVEEIRLGVGRQSEGIRGLLSDLEMRDATLEETKKELEERVKEIIALKKERDALQRSLEDAQQELANEMHERTKAEDMANTTLGELTAQEDELSKLRNDITGASVKRHEEVEVMLSDLVHVRAEVGASKRRIEELTLERDGAMKEVEEMRDTRRQYVNELESKIRAKEETVETMKAKKEAAEIQMAQLQDLRAFNDSLVAGMRALRAQMRAKEEMMKEYKDRAWGAEQNLREAVEENGELRDAERVGELEQTLNFRNAMIKDLKEQLAQAVAENADIRRALIGQRDEAISSGRKRVRMY
jgi:myosin protein heavy chain